jgi:hypothetical protein
MVPPPLRLPPSPLLSPPSGEVDVLRGGRGAASLRARAGPASGRVRERRAGGHDGRGGEGGGRSGRLGGGRRAAACAMQGGPACRVTLLLLPPSPAALHPPPPPPPPPAASARQATIMSLAGASPRGSYQVRRSRGGRRRARAGRPRTALPTAAAPSLTQPPRSACALAPAPPAVPNSWTALRCRWTSCRRCTRAPTARCSTTPGPTGTRPRAATSAPARR